MGTNPRSTLFGVYDLLEEQGCRFFSMDADDEIVPRLDGPPFEQHRERFEQAAFAYRERHFMEWVDADTTLREIDYAAKRRMNGFAFQIEDFAPDPNAWKSVLQDLVPEIRAVDLPTASENTAATYSSLPGALRGRTRSGTRRSTGASRIPRQW